MESDSERRLGTENTTVLAYLKLLILNLGILIPSTFNDACSTTWYKNWYLITVKTHLLMAH